MPKINETAKYKVENDKSVRILFMTKGTEKTFIETWSDLELADGEAGEWLELTNPPSKETTNETIVQVQILFLSWKN